MTSSPTSRWDKANLDGSVRKQKEMLEFEYARSAYKNGLKLAAELGENPFKFGLVGSTDSHIGIAAVEEDNFFGKMATGEPGPERWAHPFIKNAKSGVTILGWETQSAGFAAVWAQENTRESIFDAMHRRETYATTGSRMAVRLFGGWEFEAKDAQSRNPAVIGYGKGVPMGGDLKTAPAGKAPTFLSGRTTRSDRSQPRPLSDRQGLDGREGRTAGESLRRGWGRRPQTR